MNNCDKSSKNIAASSLCFVNNQSQQLWVFHAPSVVVQCSCSGGSKPECKDGHREKLLEGWA